MKKPAAKKKPARKKVKAQKPSKPADEPVAEPILENPEITLDVKPASGKPGRYLAIAVNGVGELHRNTFDLNSAFSRKQFITETLKKLPSETTAEVLAELRADLDAKLLGFAKVPPGEPEPAPAKGPDDPRIEALAAMPEDVRAEAAAMLADPNLLKRIVADFKRCGIVGEERLALTLYVQGTSCQFREPLSSIVRGASSSGKSYVIDKVANLFPPEVVLKTTTITTNALYYPPTVDFLKHRWVVAGERSRMEDDDKAEATRALREMISTGRLSKLVPEKQPDGTFKSRLIEQQGPIAFTESTTLGQIFEEDANRCLLLAADESEEQTQRIYKAIAKSAAGGTPDYQRVIDVHRAAQRMIPRTDVVVPFFAKVAERFPADRVDGRRSFPHLLQLVKAVALLHFRQRTRTDDGLLIADLCDYQVAVELGSSPLTAARGELSDAAIRFFKSIKAAFATTDFDSNQATEVTKLKKSTARARLTTLAEASLIEQTAKYEGNKPARYKLTGKEPNTATCLLPTVDELR